MKKFLTYLGIGILSILTTGTLLYYFQQNPKKSHLTSLIEGNRRYMKKEKKRLRPSLKNVVISNYITDLDIKDIFDTEITIYHNVSTFENIPNMKTFIILDKKENSIDCKNRLLFSKNLYKEHFTKNNIKLYWATFDESNGYVTFYHLF